VATPIDPQDDFEETSSQLNEALRSCRAVVSNYRALLAANDVGDGGQAGFTETDDETQEGVG